MSEEQITYQPPQEGDVYKEISICGIPFRLVYGYYEEFERESPFNEPMPIYPDFIKAPLYADDGIPFVTAMQDICQHYKGKVEGDSCSNCIFFTPSKDLFGFCSHPGNQLAQITNDRKTLTCRNGANPNWEEIL